MREGETFDRYRIETVLGEGGMGIVYRAFDPRLNRRVALKIVRDGAARSGPGAQGPGSSGHTNAVARLLREARAAAALDHPNAVAIFDVGEVDGVAFIAMELVAGRSVRAYVGDGAIPVAVRVRWLYDVARVLAAAHRAGLVHRDVKPENVMLRDDGLVKVLDFGIARRVHGEGAASSELGTITGAGSVAGTPVYMAPEQIRGDPVDGRTDQFAWAVTAYELLTGRMPWRPSGGGTFGMIASIVSDEPDPLRALAPDVPPIVHEIVHRALKKRPEERFASMDDVVLALEPILGVPSTRLLPPSVQSDPMLPYQRTVTTMRDLAVSASGPHRAVKRPAPVGKIAAIAGAAVAVGVIGYAAMRRAPASAPASASATASASAPASASATATALPTDPTAASEYLAGMQARHDGSERAAYEHYKRVVGIDPNFAPALLRLGMIDYAAGEELGEARDLFERAGALRATLNDEDRALLDALSPCVQLAHVDEGECARRLRVAMDRYPKAPEIAGELAARLFDQGDVESGLAMCKRGLAADPTYLSLQAYEGELTAYAGRFEESKRILADCTRRLATATQCIDYRIWVHTQLGECAAVESDARDWIAAAPHDGGRWGPHHYLANAQIALGRSDAAVRETLQQGWAKTLAEARAQDRAIDLAALAVLAGDFREAEKEATEVARLAASSTSVDDHAVAASIQVQLLEEEGRAAQAADVAGAFLDTKDSFASDPHVDDWSIAKDATMRMQAALLHAGRIDRDEYARRRATWAARYEAFAFREYEWFPEYGAWVATRDDAREALAALPAKGMPPFHPFTYPEAQLGRAYLLVDRASDALPPLKRAASGCFGLEDPFTTVRAHLWLGEALEASGAKDEACAEYATVIAKWGGAKPRSITADEARAKSRALACPAR